MRSRKSQRARVGRRAVESKRPRKAIMRRRMQERFLKEGPGAGYTFHVKGISNINLKSFEFSHEVEENLVGPDAIYSVRATATIDQLTVSSYYYGTDTMYDVPIEITQVWVSGFKANPEEATEQDIIDSIEYPEKWESTVGGGWSHSKFDGWFSDVEDSGDAQITACITDKDLIDYIDRAVQGETRWTEYMVYADEELMDDPYEDEDLAIEAGKELAESGDYNEVYVSAVEYEEDYEGNAEPTGYGDTVYRWTADDYWDEDEDEDFEESYQRRKRRMESIKRNRRNRRR